jgi:uncharacterized protein
MTASQEVRFGDDLRLAGCLDLPAGSMEVPGVVLVGGSGASDRHNDGFFRPIRSRFLAAGIAVLSYDKRGVGASSGDWASASLAELACDATAAVVALHHEPRVAADRTLLFGHSEGGWVALRAVATGAPVTSLVLSSCPATSFLAAERYALVMAGADDDDATAAVAFLGELADLAAAGAPFHEGEKAVAKAQRHPWFRALGADGFLFTPALWSQAGSWGRHDPQPDLARCSTATFAALGGSDPLVPVAASVHIYETTAISAGRLQQTRVFPGLGHRFAPLGSNQPSQAYLRALSHWACSTEGKPR